MQHSNLCVEWARATHSLFYRPAACQFSGGPRPCGWLFAAVFAFAIAGVASAQTADFGDYTFSASASSTVISTIKIGATTDTETSATTNATATGDDITGSDDEDGVTVPSTMVLGASATVTVNITNTSGATAFLNIWIDYNQNGNADSGEQVASNTLIVNGTSNANRNVTFTVPTTATVGATGMRVRLTSVPNPGIDGADGNGEVEDYLVTVGANTDFGDYTFNATASSTVISTLKIGPTTDMENSATTNATATGDDVTGTDDEDGVTVPSTLVLGASATVTVNVTNTSGASTFLNIWIDYNQNGNADSGEQVASNTVIATGTSNANRNVTFTVPTTATVGATGMRVRLTSVATPGIDGADGNGEVEDYLVTLVASSDFGDYTFSATASSTAVATIKIGATTDTEVSATTNATATGDDITGSDDEDGVTVPSTLVLGASATVTVNVTNTSGGTAFLNAWIDYNQNGNADSGEQVASNTLIANGSSNSNRNVNFTVPTSATVGTTGMRVRLTSVSSPGIDGADGNGEVEDYAVTIACPAITLAPSTFSTGKVGTAYTQTVSAAGGLTPYAYAVVGGSLPAGLALDAATGILSGTPTTVNGSGTQVTIQATAANGCHTSRQYLLTVFPVTPAWWEQRGVIDPAQTPNDFAAVNVGQLKNIAKQAMLEMNDHFMGGPGQDVLLMVNSWATTTGQTNDFAAVNVGQLKAVAKPFYDRLIAQHFAAGYPWGDAVNDFASANIGQVKQLFNFDLTKDSDLDLLPDMWEITNQLNPNDFQIDPVTSQKLAVPDDALSDADFDNQSAWREYLAGTDPFGGRMQDSTVLGWLPLEWTGLHQTEAAASAFGGTRLAKSAGTTAQDADAGSAMPILSQGAVRWVVSTPDKVGAVGLTSTNAGTTMADLSWAFLFTAVGQFEVWDAGVMIASGIPYIPADSFEIEVLNRVVRMKRNGVVLHESTTLAPPSLRVDTSFITLGFTIDRVEAWGMRTDSDNDGMDDVWENSFVAQLGWTATLADFLPGDDLDGDGVSNLDEFINGTSPGTVEPVDNDHDGLPHDFEALVAGLSDSNPADAYGDLDGDGLSNLYEFQKLGDAATAKINHSGDATDSDGDGMSDVFELEFGFDPHLFYDSVIDPDQDGVLNFEEAANALNPQKPYSRSPTLADWTVIGGAGASAAAGPNPPLVSTDWDADGLPNWWEHLFTTGIRVADADGDVDGDGTPNSGEYAKNTNPTNSDTDADGIPDATDTAPGSVTLPAGDPINHWTPTYNTGDYGEMLASRGIIGELFASESYGGGMYTEETAHGRVYNILPAILPLPWWDIPAHGGLNGFLTVCNEAMDLIASPKGNSYWERKTEWTAGERLAVTGLTVGGEIHDWSYGRGDYRFYFINSEAAKQKDTKIYFHVRDIIFPVSEAWSDDPAVLQLRTLRQRIATFQVGRTREEAKVNATVYNTMVNETMTSSLQGKSSATIITPVLLDLDVKVTGGTCPESLEDTPGCPFSATGTPNSLLIHASGMSGTFQLKSDNPGIGFGGLDVSALDASLDHTITLVRTTDQPIQRPVKITLSYTREGQNLGEVDSVTLLPVEINSMDRYFAGSLPQSTIDALSDGSEAGLVFRNTVSGEEYRFNNLSEAHVYDNPLMSSPDEEDKFLSNSEIAAWVDGPVTSTKELTQEVVFYRQNGRFHFRGLFDEVGQMEIGLLKDGNEVGTMKFTLTADEDIGSLLETVDSILAGTWDDPGGIVLAAMQQGVTGDDLEALRNAALAASAEEQAAGGGFTSFLRRNLTIKVNIPTWDAVKDKFVNGVRLAGEATARAIKVVAFGGKGFVEGAWMGVKDDATSLVDLGKMILNPAETAKTFYEGFKVLIKLDMEGWKNVGKTLVKSFLEKGEEGVDEWVEPNLPDVAAYLAGYTTGFIVEQIVATYVTAGIAKVGNIGAKIGTFVSNAAKGIKTILAPVTDALKILRQTAMKAKNSLFRRFSQDVSSIGDVKAFKRILQELELACPF